MNRTDKRAFKRAARGFKPPVTGEWGEWIEKDIYSRAIYGGVMPPANLFRFVVNDRYSVQFYKRNTTEFGEVTLLMIRPHDGRPVRDWYVFQRIKNELIGAERTAIEVFPPESELVDDANIYHLWVLPENCKLSFRID